MQHLRDIVGSGHVVVDPEVMAPYAIDWTGRFTGHPAAVVRPGDRPEVAAVVALCKEAGVALVPQGGNTGLVGGSVPLAGEVVLSLRRLGGITDVDSLGGQLSVGAGTTVVEVQAAAAAAGWAYGVDLGSRDSATIGGTIATNAGGLQVLRHGPTRAQLVGFEAVLGTSDTVSHMGGLIKDNTGYDLGGLLCGSEGTLGVVTAARVRLVPPSPERVTSILAFSSTAAAVDAASLLRRSLPELQSLELFLQSGLDLVCRVTRHGRTLCRGAHGLPLGRGGGTARPHARHGSRVRFDCRHRGCRGGHRYRPEGRSCGGTARGTPRRSTRLVRPTSWM